ncbi:MAG TPA: endolytic transglycosylase MltG [Acidimicrobiales bacterium]|nr:endolytic transglycosylase MltG [Acidimicrobiales bacterium]
MSVDTAFDIEHNDMPPERSRRPRWVLVLLGILAVAVIFGALVVSWVRGQINPSGPPGKEVQITVTKGMSTDSLASLLEREGVIKNATVFTYYARFNGADAIKAGDFTFRANSDLGEVVKVLDAGPKVEIDRITIPEGLTLKETAAKVATLPGRTAERFLALATDGTIRSRYQRAGSNNLEGYLMPETYFIDRKDDEARILTRMVSAFDDTAAQLDIAGGAAKLGVTPDQVVVVASLVEREARVDEDRAKIARVIYNRLARKMPLQIDATVQYALGEQKARLLNRDLEINSPYNTYKVSGLPPGPIASPGRESLEAALNPAAGNWLYYVLADANGRHNFAETSAQFEKFKAEAKAKGLL